MSRSLKWKDEWAFFLGTDGRRKYNDQCRRCIHDCKQSFRAEVVACSRYFSKRSEDAVYCKDKGRKWRIFRAQSRARKQPCMFSHLAVFPRYCTDKCRFQALS